MSEEVTYIQNAEAFPCPSCGSKLEYSAERKSIYCGHCGYTEDVDTSNDQVTEQSLNQALGEAPKIIAESYGKKVFDCQSCGAKFMVESDKIKVNCGFCGSKNVNLEAFDHQLIQPQGIIAFQVSREEAERYFNKWIKQGFFHPNKLKRLAALEDLHGIYLPFWTFDAQTESEWSGESGHYYYESRSVRVNGQIQAQQVRKTRWSSRSGRLNHFFDDILVVASGGLEQIHMERVLPYKLEEVVNFDPRLMVGWEAEIYNLEFDQGYDVADLIIDQKIRNMCSSQLGGDTQRNLHVHSNKHGQTFKHIILPIWISSYKYRDKIYHFTINGQTGKIYGKKPTSWFKVVGLILLFVLFMLAVFLLRESQILAR